jgi:hypothetical protein
VRKHKRRVHPQFSPRGGWGSAPGSSVLSIEPSIDRAVWTPLGESPHECELPRGNASAGFIRNAPEVATGELVPGSSRIWIEQSINRAG